VIVDGSKLTVKYYLNKRLKPLGKSNMYPVYVRIMYKRKHAQCRSLVQYFMHARLEPNFQWTIAGTIGKGNKEDEHLQYYADEKMLKAINQRKPGVAADLFETEIKIIEHTVAYFMSKGTNIIESGSPIKFIHPAMMNLAELLSEEYSSLFMAALKSEGYPKYRPLLDIISESKNHFNLLILTLKSIANKELDSFLNTFLERALIVDALKKINPHLYVIDFMINPNDTVELIKSQLSSSNSHAQSGDLFEDIKNALYPLFSELLPWDITKYLMPSIPLKKETIS